MCFEFGITAELKVGKYFSPFSFQIFSDISRYHVVQEFNKGVYDYIIATDESGAGQEYDNEDEEEEEEREEEENEEEECNLTSNYRNWLSF